MIGQSGFFMQKRYLSHAHSAGILAVHADREGPLLRLMGSMEASEPVQGTCVTLGGGAVGCLRSAPCSRWLIIS
jgi:hypothetical protein